MSDRPGKRDFKLSAMLGAGPDGVMFEAKRGERALLVHMLRHANADRIKEIRGRIDALGLLARPHLEVAGDALDGKSPWVALHIRGQCLAERTADKKYDSDEGKVLMRSITAALVDAHQLALAHGAIAPQTVFIDDQEALLDFTGAKTFGKGTVDEAEDVRQLVELADLIIEGGARGIFGSVGELAMRDALDERPTAPELLAELERLSPSSPPTPKNALPPLPPPRRVDRFGPYLLESQLGQGGMGEVWRARVVGGDAVVALKKLKDGSKYNKQRFRKEVRLLREIEHPSVARLLEFGEDPSPWMAMELVNGCDLETVVRKDGPLDEQRVLAIATSIARGLEAIHARDIVHRDLKPQNIMLAEDETTPARIIDFGIARHVDQSESLDLTAAGALIGTPYYMSPEQAAGEVCDGRSDLYSLGCVMFMSLVGRPPFRGGGGAVAIAAKHISEPAPSLAAERPETSEATCRLVANLLEKRPDDRPQSARELIEHLEGAAGRALQDIEVHPKAGAVQKGSRDYRFEWRLRAPPASLWPFVSDTERINRAIGLAAPKLDLAPGERSVAVFGQLQLAGQKLRWQEHPYEWIEGRRMGILREFSEGPFQWLRSVVELHPDGSGTHLVHTIDLVPRGVVGVAAAALEVGRKARKNLDRVYTRIDRLLATGVGALDDLYEDAPKIPAATERLFEERETRAIDLGAPRAALVKLGDYLRVAPSSELARIRPRPLAARLGTGEQETIDACIAAAATDLLALQWDLLCPTCRAPADLQDTLRALEDHGSCAACNLDFQLDWARSIELVFKAHPDLREADAGVYCVGGPVHAPHVVAQVRAAPGERFNFELRLGPGRYRVTSRWMPFSVVLVVDEAANDRRLELSLTTGAAAEHSRRLRAGRQELIIYNDGSEEQLVRVERATERDDAVMADAALSRPLFRRLFPEELIAGGRAIRTDEITLLAIDIRADDDIDRFYETYRAIVDHLSEAGGQLLKIEGEGALASFKDPIAAARAARTLKRCAAKVALAVHTGPAHVVNVDHRIDYFGVVPRTVWHLARTADDEEVAISSTVAAHAEFVSLLTEVEGRDLSVVVDQDKVKVRR